MSAFARRYAQAFVEAAPAGYDIEGFLAAAGSINRVILGQPRLKAFFAAPSIPLEAKSGVLADLARRAGLDDFGSRFFQLLLDRRRLLALASILTALREASDLRNAVVRARVTVAAALGPDQERQISEALSRRAGRQVRLATEVDERILGGFIARIGSEVFDASVRHAIERFEENASQGAKV